MLDDHEPDYRFSLANERTFLAWTRTALALIAGGVAAAKALDFHHDIWRWMIATPPILFGGVLAIDAVARWRTYENAMRTSGPLPVGRHLKLTGLALGAYAAIVLLAIALDG